MPDSRDTIVAVSAPPGRSWRGMVRLSGDRTAPIVKHLLVTSDPPWGDQPRWTGVGRLSVDGSPSHAMPVMLSWSAGPRSYTGEDTAELQCPGHPSLIERVMQRLMVLGARHAEPGEFTFRAFAAGKLDLPQAEGIHATIAATNDGELHAASLLRQGRLGTTAASLVDDLSLQLALTEAGIDFVDQDDVVPITPAALHNNLTAMTARVDDVLRHSRSWGELQGLPRVVLAGAPSAGKSTLFNALLGRARAVVSVTPGTTRDILAEPLRIALADHRQMEVMLTDLAGLDEATSLLDADAQRAAMQAIHEADLVLCVDDGLVLRGSSAWPTTRGSILRVRTKTDLATDRDTDAYDVAVSAITGDGLERLRQMIGEQCGRLTQSTSADILALQPRHEAALRAASLSLAETLAMLEPQRDDHAMRHIELVAGNMRLALDALAGLGGAMTPDDIIGKVFATFCVGK